MTTPSAGDPKTVVALIHRILCDREMTLNLIAILAVIGGFVAQGIGTQFVPGVPTGAIGVGAGVLCMVASRIVARLRRQQPPGDDTDDGSAPGDDESTSEA